ncbi:MAG: chromate transporter [Firmicutes bacterium]|nr:chromate transporter [Bacillota bacterium]MTI68996.1 chromate transporter [Bacillota bacterium]
MFYFKLFIIFFKIGAFTIGGGHAMIPLIQNEVVDKNKWLSNDEFLDAIAIAQASPGAVAINTSIFIGYKLNGVLGAFICTLGVSLPSFIIILIVSIFLFKYRKNEVVAKVFLGIKPAVVSLILSAVYKLIKAAKFKREDLIIPILSLLAITFLDISPIIIIIIGALGGIIYFRVNEYKRLKRRG